jgi:putative acetyltransferase
MMLLVRSATFPSDAAAVLAIWQEFVASPSVSLAHQGNDEEFADIPGKYAAPDGCILLAEQNNQIVGCIAYKNAVDSICEMKRLYVRPKARGMGLGRKLAERLITQARAAGYREMRLDVLAEFRHAQKLYRDLGFVEAEPISFNPLPGTQFLGLKLV